MIEGIIWAILAGLLLGLYALPEKYTKGFEYENTWGLFFLITMFIVPLISSYILLDGLKIYALIESQILIKMGIASLLWGIGIILWGKAINHIGLSLGFSIFIGTLILIGSLIPWFIDSIGGFGMNFPSFKVLSTILFGLVVVLFGVVFNGRAGILREKDDEPSGDKKGSMLSGIMIAVIGGVLATAFSYANTIGKEAFINAALACNLPAWKASIGVMNVIYVSGGCAALFYFLRTLTAQKRWGCFRSENIRINTLLILVMSAFNYTASVIFSYAASALGPEAGGTVGYAIFNAMSVLTATVAGLIVGEWRNASSKAKKFLYIGLLAMIIGIVIISIGNGLR
ncbi:MAG: L-rhamnose/proton symporter RhaT [Pontiellaceae bacterium]